MAGLDYSKCSVEELNHFVKARNIPHALCGPAIKHCLIRSLERSDSCMRFRLFDLARELRTRIYEEMLTFKDSAKGCHPQVLATCVQVHRGAAEILYTHNLLEVHVEKLYDSEPDLDYSRQIVNIRCAGFQETLNLDALEHGPLQPSLWPTYLLKLPKLQLSLNMRAYEGAELIPFVDEVPMCAIVYSLYRYLHQSKRLHSLTVTSASGFGHLNEWIDRVAQIDPKLARVATSFCFAPLIKLLARYTCTLHGHDAVAILARPEMRYLANGAEIICNGDLVSTARLLHQKIAACRDRGRSFALISGNQDRLERMADDWASLVESRFRPTNWLKVESKLHRYVAGLEDVLEDLQNDIFGFLPKAGGWW